MNFKVANYFQHDPSLIRQPHRDGPSPPATLTTVWVFILLFSPTTLGTEIVLPGLHLYIYMLHYRLTPTVIHSTPQSSLGFHWRGENQLFSLIGQETKCAQTGWTAWGDGRLRAGATRADHVCCNATTSRGHITFNNIFGNFSAQQIYFRFPKQYQENVLQVFKWNQELS